MTEHHAIGAERRETRGPYLWTLRWTGAAWEPVGLTLVDGADTRVTLATTVHAT